MTFEPGRRNDGGERVFCVEADRPRRRTVDVRGLPQLEHMGEVGRHDRWSAPSTPRRRQAGIERGHLEEQGRFDRDLDGAARGGVGHRIVDVADGPRRELRRIGPGRQMDGDLLDKSYADSSDVGADERGQRRQVTARLVMPGRRPRGQSGTPVSDGLGRRLGGGRFGGGRLGGAPHSVAEGIAPARWSVRGSPPR